MAAGTRCGARTCAARLAGRVGTRCRAEDGEVAVVGIVQVAVVVYVRACLRCLARAARGRARGRAVVRSVGRVEQARDVSGARVRRVLAVVVGMVVGIEVI